MIELVVNGVHYTDFVSAEVTTSLESMANDFTFTASAVNGFPPFRESDLVVVTVDGVKVLTGYIEEVDGTDSEGSHTVVYSGRDRTGDFIDSQIDQLADIRSTGTLTLKGLIELIIANVGGNIRVVDLLNPKPFNLAEDIVTPDVGESALSIAVTYARKRQALLSSDGDGNIVITQSSPTDSGAVVQRITGGDTNNIIAQSWTVDGTKTFNQYVQRGQLDPRALNFGGESDIASVESQGSRVTDSSVRAGRKKVTVESESYSTAQLSDRAKWARQSALAKKTRFNCTIKGHQMPAGGIWQENTLVQVNSTVADISRKMLIASATFSYTEGQPTVTTLDCVERNVYTIDQRLLSQRPAGDQNDAFKGLF